MVVTLLAGVLPIALAACTFPLDGECEEIWSTETTCNGNELVTTSCHGGGSADVNRTNCTDNGLACVSANGSASCVQPCDSNASCGAPQYCSTTIKTPDGRGICTAIGNEHEACDVANPESCAAGLSCISGACLRPCTSNDGCDAAQYCSTTTGTGGSDTCAPSGNSYDACDVSNPRSCAAGLSCVLAPPQSECANPATSFTCLQPCASNDDCPLALYCSTMVKAPDGRGTCNEAGGTNETCDPANPRSCMLNLRCVPMPESSFCVDGGGGSTGIVRVYACE
jgi:hypothetical protein